MQLPVDSHYLYPLDRQNNSKGSFICFGGRCVDKDMVQLILGVTIFWVISIIILLKPPLPPPPLSLFKIDMYRPVYVNTNGELIELLKFHGLWEITPENEIPAVLVAQFPNDLNLLDVNIKKQAFLHTLLPIVMVAQSEVKQERQYLLAISRKIDDKKFDIRHLDDTSRSHKRLTRKEKFFLRNLSKKYRSTRLSELLVRVKPVPNSLVMAQAAIESSWGDSRFVNEGNNLFGVWTWGKYGMIPARREEGKSHKVASYDTILDSVRSYILILNRVSAYGRLRRLRQQTTDPLALAEGLLYYSERRDEYVSDVKKVILSNELQKYDYCVLVDEKENSEERTIPLAGL